MAEQEDTIMTNAPLTPGDDDAALSSNADPTSPAIDYSPATVAYDEAFENSLMAAILRNTPESPRTPLPTTPIINPTTLPVPLNSPLRTYASPIPGVLLTHPNGYYTGGPGPSPSRVDEFARKFIEEQGIVDAKGLEKAVNKAIAERMEAVHARMRKREKAVRKNKEVERQLEDLRVQRAAEVSVQEKLKGARK